MKSLLPSLNVGFSRFDPFDTSSVFDNLLKDFNEVFYDKRSRSVKTWENDNEYQIQLEVPGYSKDNIQIFISKGRLDIKGEIVDSDGKGNGFNEMLTVPSNADLTKAKSTCKDGILTIFLPKKTSLENDLRQIKVD